MPKHPVQVRLILLTSNRVGTEIIVESTAVIGRLPDCDLQVDDRASSRHHARVLVSEEGVYLEDLGSSNGTKIHGKRIKMARLEDSDIIEIGETRIRVRVEGGLRGSAQEAAESRDEPEAVPQPVDELAGAEEIVLDSLSEEEANSVRLSRARPTEPLAAETLRKVAGPAAAPTKPSRPQPAAQKGKGPTAGTAGGGKTAGGILQYHRIEDRRNFLTEDLAQRGPWFQAFLLLVLLAVCAGIFYLAYSVV